MDIKYFFVFIVLPVTVGFLHAFYRTIKLRQALKENNLPVNDARINFDIRVDLETAKNSSHLLKSNEQAAFLFNAALWVERAPYILLAVFIYTLAVLVIFS